MHLINCNVKNEEQPNNLISSVNDSKPQDSTECDNRTENQQIDEVCYIIIIILSITLHSV